MTKGIGYGTSIATSTGDIAQIRAISGPGTDANDVDTTTLDSSTNYRTFLPGLIDGGEVTLDLAYGPDTISHTLLASRHNSRTVSTYTLTHGSTAWSADTQAFTAYIKGMGQEIPLDDLVTMEVTFKVSGIAGFKTTT
jgi:hypothetical protein